MKIDIVKAKSKIRIENSIWVVIYRLIKKNSDINTLNEIEKKTWDEVTINTTSLASNDATNDFIYEC